MDYDQKLTSLNETILFRSLNQIIATYAFYNNLNVIWQAQWKSDVIPSGAGICAIEGLYFFEKDYYIRHSCDLQTNKRRLTNYKIRPVNCFNCAMFVKNMILWNSSIKHFQSLCPKDFSLKLIQKAIKFFHFYLTECDAMIIISAGKVNGQYVINCGFVQNFAIKKYEASQVYFPV